MATLSKKIDLAVIVSVKNANPNGDPLNGNRPRVAYDGIGEIEDVCIKRKIRNRLMDAGHAIFVQSDDNRIDEYRSLKQRIDGEIKIPVTNGDSFRKEVCQKWIDVRAFGQVFPFKKAETDKKDKGKKADTDDDANETTNSISIGIRGPVSIHTAFSVAPVNISSVQITKSVNLEGDGTKRGSDTMGMKHRVDHGVYVFYGSMNPQLATKTGFSDEDALAIKEALKSLFQNDSSAARPEGSMEVNKVYWWEHNSPNGQYSSAQVHRSLKVSVKEGISEPKTIDDYSIGVINLEGLIPEIINGL